MLKSKTFFHFSRSIVTKADLNTNYTLISKPTLLHHKERAITSQSSASLPIRLATTLYTFTPQTHVRLPPKSDNWPPPTLAASARLPHAWRTTCECFLLILARPLFAIAAQPIYKYHPICTPHNSQRNPRTDAGADRRPSVRPHESNLTDQLIAHPSSPRRDHNAKRWCSPKLASRRSQHLRPAWSSTCVWVVVGCGELCWMWVYVDTNKEPSFSLRVFGRVFVLVLAVKTCFTGGDLSIDISFFFSLELVWALCKNY